MAPRLKERYQQEVVPALQRALAMLGESGALEDYSAETGSQSGINAARPCSARMPGGNFKAFLYPESFHGIVVGCEKISHAWFIWTVLGFHQHDDYELVVP